MLAALDALPILLGLALTGQPQFVSFAHAYLEGEYLRVVIAADAPLSAQAVRTKLAARHLHVYLTGLRARADNRAWLATEPGWLPVVAHRHAGEVEIKAALPSAATCKPPVTVREQDGRLVAEVTCTGGEPVVVARVAAQASAQAQDQAKPGGETEAPAPIAVEDESRAPAPVASADSRGPSGEEVGEQHAPRIFPWWLLLPVGVALLVCGGALAVRRHVRARPPESAESARKAVPVVAPEKLAAPAPNESAPIEPTPPVTALPVATPPVATPQPSAERSALERRLLKALFDPPGPGDLA